MKTGCRISTGVQSLKRISFRSYLPNSILSVSSNPWNRLTVSALLRRFGSTALSLSSARLWNSFLSRLRLKELQTVLAVRLADRICSASAVPSPPRFATQKRPPCRVLLR